MKTDIENALKVLNNGGLILYPTDTIWGIGCDATNSEAVEKIYKLKKRSTEKSMLILLPSINRITAYADTVPNIAMDILEITGKPTTIIFDNAKNLPVNLINSDGSIAIRVPDDIFCQSLLKRFKRPIVSTSANFTGTVSPRNFAEIDKKVIENCNYVVKHRQRDTNKGKSSSIIKISEKGQVEIIRN